jgi:2-methylcitrate dehydratase PrpD
VGETPDPTEGAAVAALAENVLNTRFEDLGTETVETMKGRVIDVVGCAIGGANAPGNRGLIELVRGWGGNPEATLWVHGGKMLAQDAAMVNAVMTRSYDFEEQAPMEHQSATTIPVAMALTEMSGRSGKDFLTALIVGADVGNRISASFDFDFYQGFDNIGSLHTFASTAIAGRLLNLTVSQLKNAFGIALHQTAGSIASYWDCDTTFKLNNGFAARTGILAAEYAKAGLVGAADALQGRFGYFSLYTHGCSHPEKLTEELGEQYVLGNDMYKRFPCGRPTHVPIELGIAIANENKMRVADIAEVILTLPQRFMTIYYAQPFRIRSYPLADALFSFQYTLASALLRGHVGLADMTEEAIRDPEVNALIQKIDLREHTRADMGVEVVVKLRDGTELSKSGDGRSRGLLGRDDIKAKFMAQVEFSQTVSLERAEKLISLLERLEEIEDVRQVIESMCGERSQTAVGRDAQ